MVKKKIVKKGVKNKSSKSVSTKSSSKSKNKNSNSRTSKKVSKVSGNVSKKVSRNSNKSSAKKAAPKKIKKSKRAKSSKKALTTIFKNNSSTSEDTNVSAGQGGLSKSFEEIEKNKSVEDSDIKVLGEYTYVSDGIPIIVSVQKKKGEFVPIYNLKISAISPTTDVIIEGVRQELIRRVNLGIAEISDYKNVNLVEEKFEKMIKILIEKYFPDSDEETEKFLRTYLKMKSLGLGTLELLMDDDLLEELVVNQGDEPVWVYHKRHGWLKTTVKLKDEDQTKHYASIIGRKVGRQISVLNPLLDAHLESGDRVNATLYPVSTEGNTITIRKFSKDPWTITKFLKSNTISYKAAALVWTAIQYEMSALITGGTASGKTSALNVFAGFFPPNQRIISIEDTREIRLPKFLHWVPLNTILANPEGKGEISMQDLLVNSLRMRPDRILVGEVRRNKETDTLFEAIHTGHSAYATFHANNAKEVVDRLTNSPLNVPKIMLPAIALIVVQFRNRRTGKRRTFQIAEVTSDGDANVIMKYDPKRDELVDANKSVAFFDNIKTFTGVSDKEFNDDLKEKIKILKYLVDNNIETVDGVGRVIAEYYTDKDNLMKYVNKGETFSD